MLEANSDFFHSQVLAAPSGLYLHCLTHKHPSFPFSWLPQQFRSAPFPSQYPLPPLTPYIMDNCSFLKQLPGFKGSQFIYRKDMQTHWLGCQALAREPRPTWPGLSPLLWHLGIFSGCLYVQGRSPLVSCL